MIYTYVEKNRLEQPCHYMYTSFEGADMLASYFSSRSGCENLFDSIQEEKYIDTMSAFILEKVASKVRIEKSVNIRTTSKEKSSVISLGEFDVNDSIVTEKLLYSLIINQAHEHGFSPLVGVWANRLVQRFEVSKKLYELYPSGFRKGEGGSSNIKLYWLFSLSLCLAYFSSRNLQYLSTLLKVNDTLCSLEKEQLERFIPLNGLQLVLKLEADYVKKLIDDETNEVLCI